MPRSPLAWQHAFSTHCGRRYTRGAKPNSTRRPVDDVSGFPLFCSVKSRLNKTIREQRVSIFIGHNYKGIHLGEQEPGALQGSAYRAPYRHKHSVPGASEVVSFRMSLHAWPSMMSCTPTNRRRVHTHSSQDENANSECFETTTFRCRSG